MCTMYRMCKYFLPTKHVFVHVHVYINCSIYIIISTDIVKCSFTRARGSRDIHVLRTLMSYFAIDCLRHPTNPGIFFYIYS